MQAQFYSFAAFGVGLNSSLTANGPAPIGGAAASLSGLIKPYAIEIANDEIAHVRPYAQKQLAISFLKQQLGLTSALRVQTPDSL